MDAPQQPDSKPEQSQIAATPVQAKVIENEPAKAPVVNEVEKQ